MKKLIPFLILIPLLLAGCAGHQIISPGMVRSGTAALTRKYTTNGYTNAIPAVRVARDVICVSANSTNISPDQIVLDIQNSASWTALRTSEAELIITGAILLYESAWNSWGTTAVNNAPVFKEYLGSVCLGLGDGLGVMTVNRNAPSLTPLIDRQWPLLDLK